MIICFSISLMIFKNDNLLVFCSSLQTELTPIWFELFARLWECTIESCCSSVAENYPVTACSKTQGPIGEIISNFPESPYLQLLGNRRSLEGGFRQVVKILQFLFLVLSQLKMHWTHDSSYFKTLSYFWVHA